MAAWAAAGMVTQFFRQGILFLRWVHVGGAGQATAAIRHGRWHAVRLLVAL